MSREIAENELVAVSKKIEKLSAQIRDLHEKATRLRTYIAVDAELRGAVEASSAQEREATGQLKRKGGGGKAGEVRRLVVERLQAVGEPQTTAALVAWLESQGMSLTPPDRSERATAELAAVLSRDKENFVASRKVGWRLVSWLHRDSGTVADEAHRPDDLL